MSFPTITSRQNVRIKDATRLRQRRQRDRQGRFLIDGIREINRALDAQIEVVESYVCTSLCQSAEAQATVTRLTELRASLWPVTPAVFEKLCFGQRDDGIVVVAITPDRTLDRLNLPPRPVVAILEALEKPGNVGAILRSADGAGIDGIVLADPCTDLMNPNTIRASLGTLFGPNICTATTEETIGWLRKKKIPVIMARPDAVRCYTELDYRGPAAIVLGSEADGLTSRWQEVEGVAISLPMHGVADSLNVSATAAILFYEAQQQRVGRGLEPT